MSHETATSRPDTPVVRVGVVHRHPLLCFVVPAVTITWAIQFAFLAAGAPLFPALLLELVVLVGCATTVTAMPAATLLVAALSGTLDTSSGEWLSAAVQYLAITIVFGALLGNMWEELAWMGFLQSRLMDQRGLLIGSLLTSVPFGLIHLPMAFEADGLGGTALSTLAVDWGLLLLVAPFFRVLLGIVYTRTGRSLLSVALLHGSFNACSGLSLVDGGWQYIPAAIAVSIVVVAVHWRQLADNYRAARR